VDIGRAITFPFQDSEWVKKVLLGGLIALIPIIGGFVVYGYALEVARRVYLDDPQPLPEWAEDFGGFLVRGFIFSVALFIWLLPFMILFGVAAGLGAALGNASDALGAAVGITTGIVVFILMMVWLVAIIPIAGARYAVEQRFGVMFEVGEILSEARLAGSAVLILFLAAIIASIIAMAGFLLCFVGVIFTSFYSYLIIGHAAGQLYRRARGYEEARPAAPAF
jgi:hypothetical protein